MTTLIVCIRRRPGMTPQEFSSYWRERHGPLIQACPDFKRHLSSYVQYHLIDGNSDIAKMFGVSGEYDGVAVLRFHDENALRQAFKEPAYLEMVRPDEPNFVDLDHSMSFIAEPAVMV